MGLRALTNGPQDEKKKNQQDKLRCRSPVPVKGPKTEELLEAAETLEA